MPKLVGSRVVEGDEKINGKRILAGAEAQELKNGDIVRRKNRMKIPTVVLYGKN